MTTLDLVVDSLGSSRAVQDKIAIRKAYAPAIPTTRGVATLGDDCAAIPDGEGRYLLFAAEGLMDDFVADDPWFAGYSAIMVNISDICAMGGRPLAVTDVIWTPSSDQATPVWDGMRAAADAYGVPIVGGHTTVTEEGTAVHLAVSILGRASSLLTSFDARPGDVLLMAVDLDGSYRGDKPFWNASVRATSERLQSLIELLPHIAEEGWSRAAKDISNGGVVGTLIMLLDCSGVGATVDLESIPRPAGVELMPWLTSFPSFGYLLSVAPQFSEPVRRLFAAHDVACEVIGSLATEPRLVLRQGGAERVFWSAAPRGENNS